MEQVETKDVTEVKDVKKKEEVIHTISWGEQKPLVELHAKHRKALKKSIRMYFDTLFTNIQCVADTINAEKQAEILIETAERLHFKDLARQMRIDYKENN